MLVVVGGGGGGGGSPPKNFYIRARLRSRIQDMEFTAELSTGAIV